MNNNCAIIAVMLLKSMFQSYYMLSDVNNILIYVADGLRWKDSPSSIKALGSCFKTVAASLYSPPSFATLLTGLYPQQHGVYNWRNTLSKDISRLLDINGYHCGYTDSKDQDRLFQTLRVSNSTSVANLHTPFISIERNQQTHYPYNQTSMDASYFENDWGSIVQDYQNSIESTVSAFQTRLDHLEDRGILDETLVIFTSDHGELLGEHSETLHVAPACPELAYVPTVFIHPELSESSFQVDTTSEIIEHVDIVRTALSMLDNVEMKTMGTNIIGNTRSRQWGYNHANVRRRQISLYTSDSLWWHDGGISILKNSLTGRMLYYLYKLTHSVSSPKIRDHPIKTLLNYVRGEYIYGDIPVSSETAEETLSDFVATLDKVEPEVIDLDDKTREHLREMGYLT